MNSTTNLPRYSIIVPVYNVEDYLPECVDSLLAQDTATPYEILLVDDGSTDSSGSICDAYADKDARVRVIHKSNGGVSSARNTGIQMAKGTYIFFVDSDDILEPEFLSEFSPLLADGTDLALCGNVRFYPDGREETEHLPLKPKGESGQTYLQSLFSMDKLPRAYSCSVAFRKDFLTQNQLAFREELSVSEDFEFMMRCIPAASRVQGIDAPLYRYRMRAESLSHTLSWKKLKNNLQVKAAVYRKYPTGATANYFADSALMISLLFDGREEAEQFVQDNRDIISQVTQSSLKVYRCMLALLGPIKASWLYLHLKKGLRRD